MAPNESSFLLFVPLNTAGLLIQKNIAKMLAWRKKMCSFITRSPESQSEIACQQHVPQGTLEGRFFSLY
jgi:hypothetical protein